jgi:hypothetical protein
MSDTRINELATDKLLSTFAEILETLRDRGVVRSANNPVADYAEWLVQKALSVKLAKNSTTGYDAVDSSGQRYEIKARRFTPRGKMTHFSAIRGLEKRHFDRLAAVVFNQDFSVKRAGLIPYEIVKERAVFRNHVNAWVLSVREELWNLEGVEDITEKLRAVQNDEGPSSQCCISLRT